MNEINWSHEYSVGNQSLDNQHQKIISLINQLIKLENSTFSFDQLKKLINELNQYASEHLEYEETLLNQLDYPDYNNHILKHQLYKETIKRFSDKCLLHKEKSVVLSYTQFLYHWWNEHILKEDMQYKNFIDIHLVNDENNNTRDIAC